MRVSQSVFKFTGILLVIALSFQVTILTCAGDAFASANPSLHSGLKMEDTAHGADDKAPLSGDNMDFCQHQCSSAFIQTLPATVTSYSPILQYVTMSSDLHVKNISKTIFQPPRNTR